MARSVLAFLAALWLSAASAADSVFYQPQVRDAVVTAEEWRQMFRSLHGQGTSTLVVQWTRYGDERFGGRGGWLDRVLQLAAGEGLGLELGLYADPAFFAWAQERGPALAARLRSHVRENLAVAAQWNELSTTGAVRGWYLPAELDDLNWQAEDKRGLLAEALQELRAGLGGGPAKLSLSAFFGGYMAPPDYAAWLRDVVAGGWFVWVQDGSGTGQLSAAQRRIYLDALFPCPGSEELGLIVESFRQMSSADKPFRARPATAAELESIRQDYRRHCPARQAVFSLRYLPVAAGIMAHD